MEIFLRPLFGNAPEKIYNLKKCTELQRPIRKKEAEESGEVMEFGEEGWMEEEEKRRQEKLKKYERSLGCLLGKALEAKQWEVSLEEIKSSLTADGGKTEDGTEDYSGLIPNVQIFKEIMVELIKGGDIDIRQLREERRNYIGEFSGGFQLNEMILNLTETMAPKLRRIEVYRIDDGKAVTFENVGDDDGGRRQIRCSNVLFRLS